MHAATTPPRAELRRFGLTTGAIVAALFGVVLPLLFGRPLPLWPWILAAALVLPALAVPQALGPVHRGWMKFGHVLGWINTRVILGILFFAVVTPISALMRLLGKDPMHKRLETDKSTYRVDAHKRGPDHFERPF